MALPLKQISLVITSLTGSAVTYKVVGSSSFNQDESMEIRSIEDEDKLLEVDFEDDEELEMIVIDLQNGELNLEELENIDEIAEKIVAAVESASAPSTKAIQEAIVNVSDEEEQVSEVSNDQPQQEEVASVSTDSKSEEESASKVEEVIAVKAAEETQKQTSTPSVSISAVLISPEATGSESKEKETVVSAPKLEVKAPVPKVVDPKLVHVYKDNDFSFDLPDSWSLFSKLSWSKTPSVEADSSRNTKAKVSIVKSKAKEKSVSGERRNFLKGIPTSSHLKSKPLVNGWTYYREYQKVILVAPDGSGSTQTWKKRLTNTLRRDGNSVTQLAARKRSSGSRVR